MPCFRARSAVFAPASCSFSTAMICSSVNLARFICPSFIRPDSNSAWRKFAGAGHRQKIDLQPLAGVGIGEGLTGGHCATPVRVSNLSLLLKVNQGYYMTQGSRKDSV